MLLQLRTSRLDAYQRMQHSEQQFYPLNPPSTLYNVSTQIDFFYHFMETLLIVRTPVPSLHCS